MLNSSYRARPNGFGDLHRLQDFLDHAFGAERANIRAQSGTAFPVINVGSTPETVEVMAMAPGLDASRLELTIDRGLLIIAGQRPPVTPPQGDRVSVYTQERFSGTFRRVISLPADVDPTKVDAIYREGILRITLHKRESSKPRKIQIA